MDYIAMRINVIMKVYEQWAVGIEEMGKLRLSKNEASLDSFRVMAYTYSHIRRFEICYELTSKLGKVFLQEKHDLIANSPGLIFDGLHKVNIINKEELAVLRAIMKDRNLTDQIYDEDFAEKMSLRIEAYYSLMYKMVTEIAKQLQK